MTSPTEITADRSADQGLLPAALPGALPGAAGTLLVPAERWYWAVLTPPGSADARKVAGAPRAVSGHAAEPLRFAFEPLLPAPLEEVETRFVRLRDGRALACGVDADALSAWLDAEESAGRAVESVRPGAVPACVAALLGDTDDPAALLALLEFRNETFESPRRREAARRRNLTLAATAILCAALAVAGSLRGAAACRDEAARARTAADALAATSIAAAGGRPGGHSEGASGREAESAPLLLSALVRGMERRTDRAALAVIAEDRSALLVALLAAWPDSVDTRVEQVRIEQDVLSVRGAAGTAADAERVAGALVGFAPGWAEESRSATRSGDFFVFSVTHRRVTGGGQPPSAATGAVSRGSAVTSSPAVALTEHAANKAELRPGGAR